MGVDEVGVGAEAEAGADLGGVHVFGEQLDQRVAVLHHEVVALALQIEHNDNVMRQQLINKRAMAL